MSTETTPELLPCKCDPLGFGGHDADCPHGYPQPIFTRTPPMSEVSEELAAYRRNVYRLQAGGARLTKALKYIANGCEGRIDADSIPALIAKDALAHREPDPKNWEEALSSTPDERAMIVGWLRDDAQRCDCFAHSESECCCGAWASDPGERSCKRVYVEDIADAIERGDFIAGGGDALKETDHD